MDYRFQYTKLIDRAKARTLRGYTETHHIVPKCVGGTDEIANLVELTAREHYVAHLLLVKMYPTEPKLVFAANMMCLAFTTERNTNRRYGWLREKVAEHSSQMNNGARNPFYGKTHTPDTCVVLSEKAKQRDPETRKWREGRKTPVYSESRSEIQKRAAETRKKNGNNRLSEETKEKIRETKRNQDLEVKRKGGLKNKGRIHSEETKKAMSEAHKGQTPWNKGIPLTDSEKQKRSTTMKTVSVYTGNEKCCYGCFQQASYTRTTSRGEIRFMCADSSNKCPAVLDKRKKK